MLYRHPPLTLLTLSQAVVGNMEEKEWRCSGSWRWGCKRRLTLRACSPVLRTLARLKPTMTLEEGMQQAMQEWQHMSTVERMAFYEMAAK